MIDLPIKISIKEEYDLAVARGYSPLSDYKKFYIDIDLRIDLQRQIFGNSFISKGDLVQANNRFYKWCWNNSPHRCEECATPLGDNFAAIYVSHILTRGANSEKAHDPRNKNMLCPKHHNQWENEKERKTMRIYKTNLKIIALLIKDYQLR